MFAVSHLRDRLNQSRILVVGDLMLDCYCWGAVRRISPEAPVPVVKVKEKTYRLGGAGNVVANLCGLGCSTALVSVIGKDGPAARLGEMLASLGVDNRCVVDARRPTTTKTRIMADKQQVARLDEEQAHALEKELAGQLAGVVETCLDAVQAVILSDYGKGMFGCGDLIQAVIRACRQRALPVFVDPKGRDWQRYKGATCITPNTAELEQVTAGTLGNGADWTPVARDLCRALDLDALLVTRGPKGMRLFDGQSPPLSIPAKAKEVFDVSGAGDTVIATLAACVAAGLPFCEAASVANCAAGIVVGKLGTQPVSWQEVARALEDGDRRSTEPSLRKVAAAAEAENRLAGWRQGQQTIVFTNGCFDLLHPGHVSLLHRARRLGDRLIVGLNTDASIRRLKGARRPILPEADRAAILCALEDVDMVVFFDEDTPLQLIRRLKPDILVKGADYRIEDVVGKEVVEAYGGQVQLVKLLQGHSTTALANKLLHNG